MRRTSGGVVSATTVTLNVPVVSLRLASVAVQLTTVVVPASNVDPEAGVQTGVIAPSTVSVAVAVNVTTGFVVVMSSGSVSSGGVVSDTMTSMSSVPVPFASVAVQCTVEMPSGKKLPETGVHTASRFGSTSLCTTTV